MEQLEISKLPQTMQKTTNEVDASKLSMKDGKIDNKGINLFQQKVNDELLSTNQISNEDYKAVLGLETSQNNENAVISNKTKNKPSFGFTVGAITVGAFGAIPGAMCTEKCLKKLLPKLTYKSPLYGALCLSGGYLGAIISIAAIFGGRALYNHIDKKNLEKSDTEFTQQCKRKNP